MVQQAKGDGFIGHDGEPDVYVYFSAILNEGFKSPKDSDRVTFDIVQGEKGPQSAKVNPADMEDRNPSVMPNFSTYKTLSHFTTGLAASAGPSVPSGRAIVPSSYSNAIPNPMELAWPRPPSSWDHTERSVVSNPRASKSIPTIDLLHSLEVLKSRTFKVSVSTWGYAKEF